MRSYCEPSNDPILPKQVPQPHEIIHQKVKAIKVEREKQKDIQNN